MHAGGEARTSMCRVGACVAAWVVAVALSAGVISAYAGDWPSGGEDTHFLYFAGTDLWRNGEFVHGGVLWSPEGLDHDGFVLKGMLGGGIYHYISGALGNADVMGRQISASVLPGWRFTRDHFTVTLFAGLDLQNHHLTPDDPSAGLRGSYAGLRTGFDLWYEPTAATMVAADASPSTVGPSYSGRLIRGASRSAGVSTTGSISGLTCRALRPTVTIGSSASAPTSPGSKPKRGNGRAARASPTTATTTVASTARSAC